MFRLNVPDGPYVRIERRGTYPMAPHAPVVLLVDEFGADYARLSVNPPAERVWVELPTSDHFWLKDWSENKAIVDDLIAQGVLTIDTRIGPVPSGFVEIKAAFIGAPRDDMGVFVLESFDQIKG